MLSLPEQSQIGRWRRRLVGQT